MFVTTLKQARPGLGSVLTGWHKILPGGDIFAPAQAGWFGGRKGLWEDIKWMWVFGRGRIDHKADQAQTKS